MLDPGLLITMSLSAVAAIVWAVRVEGRVNGHDKSFVDLDKLLEERDDKVLERHNEIARRLSRIEAKLDAVKNGN